MTIRDLVDYFEAPIQALSESPILMGHSFGGLIVQMLLDPGLGAAGVAFAAGPPRGILPSPTPIRSALPMLLAWRGWSRILTMSCRSRVSQKLSSMPFQPSDESNLVAYRLVAWTHLFPSGLRPWKRGELQEPKTWAAAVDAAGEDRTCTPSMARAIHQKQRCASSLTDILEFPRSSYWLIAEPGLEEVADKVVVWAEACASPQMPRLERAGVVYFHWHL